MNKRHTSPGRPRALHVVLLALAALCLSAAPALGQATSGGTSISNTASATYSDGTVKKVPAPVSMYTEVRYEWSDAFAPGGKLSASYKVRVK